MNRWKTMLTYNFQKIISRGGSEWSSDMDDEGRPSINFHRPIITIITVISSIS
jgi:hypothetical protein